MSEQNLFITEQCPKSRRFAVLEDNGISAWLYLTDPGSRKPGVDVWVYNRGAAPTPDEVRAYRGGPPPAPIGFAGNDSQCRTPTKHDWSMVWSEDGESVALLRDGVPVACILCGSKTGMSRQLIKTGPWGSVWSQETFERIFGPNSIHKDRAADE